jgi:PIN domain
MISLRLVVDTNIVVSAALKPDGLQRTVLLIAITKPARLYISKAIFTEYSEKGVARGGRAEVVRWTPATTPAVSHSSERFI